jgi:hypothetical protein
MLIFCTCVVFMSKKQTFFDMIMGAVNFLLKHCEINRIPAEKFVSQSTLFL